MNTKTPQTPPLITDYSPEIREAIEVQADVIRNRHFDQERLSLQEVTCYLGFGSTKTAKRRRDAGQFPREYSENGYNPIFWVLDVAEFVVLRGGKSTRKAA